MKHPYSLRCPKDGSLLGKAADPWAADRLLLWCKKCKSEVKPDAVKDAPAPVIR